MRLLIHYRKERLLQVEPRPDQKRTKRHEPDIIAEALDEQCLNIHYWGYLTRLDEVWHVLSLTAEF